MQTYFFVVCFTLIFLVLVYVLLLKFKRCYSFFDSYYYLKLVFELSLLRLFLLFFFDAANFYDLFFV